MIISASRRTDIPAFYGEWLIRRLRDGYCHVANPFRPDQISRVSLAPADVDAIALWSKNPAPLLPHLDEIDRRGFRYYVLFTLNPYSRPLEPGLPPLDERIATFRRLADWVGPSRVVWRYDPIILTRKMGVNVHIDAFSRLASALQGSTRRVIISLLDFYRKTERRLAPLENANDDPICRDPFAHPDLMALAGELAGISAAHGMEIQSCAEDARLQAMGIKPGKCIDDELIRREFGIRLDGGKDRGQREHCLCAVSRDIGAVDTCPHGCEYCYSTVSNAIARERFRRHDPSSPLLVEP